MASRPKFLIFASLFAAFALTACGSERPLNPYNADTSTDNLPGDTQWVGNRIVTSAALDGDIAEVQGFAGQPRVRVDDYGRGFTMVELAMRNGERAVMHRLEIDGGLSQLEPGTTLTFDTGEVPEGEQTPWVYPVACTGPDVDLWEVDVPVDQVDLSVEEGPTEGSLRYDWTLTKTISFDSGEPTTQVSHGSFVLSEPGPMQ